MFKKTNPQQNLFGGKLWGHSCRTCIEFDSAQKNYALGTNNGLRCY